MKQQKKKVKIEKKAGASLAIVMIILVVFTAFSLTLLQSAGLMLSQANRRLEQERCYQLAKSFAEVLEKELFKYNDVLPTSAPTESFYRYANDFLKGIYGEYDPDHPDITTYHYTAATSGSDEEIYGDVKVILRKETNQDSDLGMSGKIGDQSVNEIEDRTFIRYIFTVDVEVTLGNVTYNYQTEYNSREAYKAQYKLDYNNTEYMLVWVPIGNIGEFHLWNGGGELFPNTTMPGVDIKDIEYTYDTSQIVRCVFEKTNAE